MTEYHQEAAESTVTVQQDRTFECAVCRALDGESESHQQYRHWALSQNWSGDSSTYWTLSGSEEEGMEFWQLLVFHYKIPETMRNLCKTVIKNDNSVAHYGTQCIHSRQTASTWLFAYVVFQFPECIRHCRKQNRNCQLLSCFHLPEPKCRKCYKLLWKSSIYLTENLVPAHLMRINI